MATNPVPPPRAQTSKAVAAAVASTVAGGFPPLGPPPPAAYPVGEAPSNVSSPHRQANPFADCFQPVSGGSRDQKIKEFFRNLLWNMNIILAQQTYNGYSGKVAAGGVPQNELRWVIPGRLWDGARIDIAPRNRAQLMALDIDGWHAVARHYGFDWRIEELSIEHCRARWVTWCGCRGITPAEAVNGYVAPAAAPAGNAPAANDGGDGGDGGDGN